jgi:DNA-binding beta-propeller fold protein YncE
MHRSACLLAVLTACGHSSKPSTTTATAAPAIAKTIALPGAPSDGVFLDYLAYDAAHHRVWVPAGGTGKVDVIETSTNALTPIEGFVTKEMERKGKKRQVGPSSATVGDGIVYIGNRGDSSICAFDAATLAKQGCVTLDAMPDGLQYVAATKEVWVTTPRDQSIRTLDVSSPGQPAIKDTIKFEGEPEGFAVDNAAGVFFTNLENKDKSLVVDLKTHAITKTWDAKCGEDGPKGLILEADTHHLIVVCADHLQTLDTTTGAVIATLAVGDGLDAIDYIPSRRQVFAAAGRAEKMVVARLERDGKLTAVSTIATAKGARNAVATEDGTSYLAAGPEGQILVVAPVQVAP